MCEPYTDKEEKLNNLSSDKLNELEAARIQLRQNILDDRPDATLSKVLHQPIDQNTSQEIISELMWLMTDDSTIRYEVVRYQSVGKTQRAVNRSQAA